jgi:hypothetical protein
VRRSYEDRRAELINLLEWAQLPDAAREGSPFPSGRRSPLIEGEDKMKVTAAILAARHCTFNGEGLGFDLPGTADWPSIILVGPGGRETNEDAVRAFFDLPADNELAKRMCKEPPSAQLVDSIKALDAGRPQAGRSGPIPISYALH